VRVPLILRWPGRIPAGTVSHALVEITDVFPTLVEAAGGQPSRRCLGRSLWPVLRDPQAEIRDYQLSEIDVGERHLMIRSRRHKYVADGEGRGFMLYDLERDPDEQSNLAAGGSAPALERELRDALLRRLVEAQYCL
jgi:arylsulfatase A-like enzyme